MKNKLITLKIFVIWISLFFSYSSFSFENLDLPPCPNNIDTTTFHNCIGRGIHYAGDERHTYYGSWKNGKENGLGIHTMPGERYIGEFKDGQYHGLGVNRFNNGNRAIGQFKNMLVDGYVLYTNRDGSALYAYESADQDLPYNSNVHDVIPNLKKDFYLLTLNQRMTLQKILKDNEFYQGEIDGVWGRQTLNALAEFIVIRLKRVDFNSNNMIDNIINAALKRNEAKPALETEHNNKIVKAASGTGFFVSKNGTIVTNNHVVKGCTSVSVNINNETFKAVFIAKDTSNDLAILSINKKNTAALPLANDNPKLLQDIYASGYPFGSSFSSSLKVTRGIVSSVTGLSNNYSQIQIDAAIQPGNSGGPIVDDNGNVVGVAVSKLDVKKVLKNYGVIPENVNFGVKVGTLKNLLESNNIKSIKPNKRRISKTKLGNNLTKATVFLSCYMTMADVRKMRTQKALFPELEK